MNVFTCFSLSIIYEGIYSYKLLTIKKCKRFQTYTDINISPSFVRFYKVFVFNLYIYSQKISSILMKEGCWCQINILLQSVNIILVSVDDNYISILSL